MLIQHLCRTTYVVIRIGVLLPHRVFGIALLGEGLPHRAIEVVGSVGDVVSADDAGAPRLDDTPLCIVVISGGGVAVVGHMTIALIYAGLCFCLIVRMA